MAVPDYDYLPGSSAAETKRLMLQAAILRGMTERWLRDAGIGPGMRVVDIGCGAGDVSLLAAEMVGPTGRVIGLDRDPRAIATASGRAAEAGQLHVSFAVATDEAFGQFGPADAVIGRYVLMHQPDPAALLRRAASLVGPGGIIAFLEPDHHCEAAALPEVKLARDVALWVRETLRRSLPNYDIGGRMVTVFQEAGLPQPQVFCEAPVTGGEGASATFGFMADTVRILMPRIVQLGIATEAEIDIDTLGVRLEQAVAASHSQHRGALHFGAWVRQV